MPHLFAHKNNNYRHLVRWNNSPSSAAKHLGAGYITIELAPAEYKCWMFGKLDQYGRVTYSYQANATRAGQQAVAAALKNGILTSNPAGNVSGSGWITGNWEPFFDMYCGGLDWSLNDCRLGSGSFMMIPAKRFALPSQYSGLTIVDMTLKYKGFGAFHFAGNQITNSQGGCYAMKDWVDNNAVGGTQYKITADKYWDNQSVAAHTTTNLAAFKPYSLWYAFDRNGSRVEFYSALTDLVNATGRDRPTVDDWLRYKNVDLDASENIHWRTWGRQGSVNGSAQAWFPHTWAMAHGGSWGNRVLWQSGGYLKYIGGASWYPNDGSTYCFLRWQPTDQEIAAVQNGTLWCIICPFNSLDDLYTNATDTKAAGSQQISIADYRLEVTLG